MTEQCSGCRFYDAFEEGDPESQGWCRRYPPVLVVPPVPEAIAGYTPGEYQQPVVDHGMWCGEFKPREESKESKA